MIADLPPDIFSAHLAHVQFGTVVFVIRSTHVSIFRVALAWEEHTVGMCSRITSHQNVWTLYVIR